MYEYKCSNVLLITGFYGWIVGLMGGLFRGILDDFL
jgi:hypothetical protein